MIKIAANEYKELLPGIIAIKSNLSTGGVAIIDDNFNKIMYTRTGDPNTLFSLDEFGTEILNNEIYISRYNKNHKTTSMYSLSHKIIPNFKNYKLSIYQNYLYKLPNIDILNNNNELLLIYKYINISLISDIVKLILYKLLECIGNDKTLYQEIIINYF